MNAAIKYRLLSLEFRGMKRKAGFRGAMLRHNPAGRFVTITNLLTPPAVVDRYLAEIDGREIRAIRYQIIVTDPRSGRRLHPPITYCHPLPRGTRVKITTKDGERDTIYLARQGAGRFFSDNFRLGDVTDGAVESPQRVYQFHE